MARKTTGNTVAKRGKKAEVPVAPVEVQVAPEINTDVPAEGRKGNPGNGKRANIVPGTVPRNVPVNMEEEIRRRAYELYLQRRATAGGEYGNKDQDWLIAEREILSRYDKLALHTTA